MTAREVSPAAVRLKMYGGIPLTEAESEWVARTFDETDLYAPSAPRIRERGSANPQRDGQGGGA